MTDRTLESSPQSNDRENRPAGIERRHLIHGAAWSVPVIMMATTVPAYAASGKAVALAFNQPTYTAKGCKTITGATVTATVDQGVPQAGVSVSVLLPSGYTFPGGSTTYTGVTNGSGVLTVPAITTPATGGKTTLTALAAASGTTLTATATSQANVTPGISGYAATNASQGSVFASVPVGAVPLGSSYFLAGSDLYFENTKVASGVISAYVYATLTSAAVSYNTNSGGNRATAATVAESYTGVPTSARSVGADYYLTNAGDLYYKGSKVATGAQSAVGAYRDSHYTVEYIDTHNAKHLMYEGVEQGSPVTYPAGALIPVTPLGVGYFLTGGGDLYSGDTKVASGVLSASTYASWDEWTAVSFNTATGTYRANNGALTAGYGAIPLTAKSVGADYYLTPEGGLYFRDAKIADGVTSAVGVERELYWSVNYIDASGAARSSARTGDDKNFYDWGVATAVPTGSPAKALGGGYFLTGGGDLYFGDTKVWSGVLSATMYASWNEWYAVSFNTAAGTYRANNGGLTGAFGAIPLTARSVGADYFLTPSGDLYFRDKVIASGVTSAVGVEREQYWSVNYMDSTGAARSSARTGDDKNFYDWGVAASVPSNAVSVGAGYWLTPGGDLYYGNTKVLTGIIKATGWIRTEWQPRATALGTDGKVRLLVGKDVSSTFAGSFTGGTPLRAGYALSAAGDLYYGDALVASGVVSAEGYEKDSAVVSIVFKDGTAKRAAGASIDATFVQVPYRTTSVGAGYWLTPGGDLYYANAMVLSGVVAATAWIRSEWQPRATVLGLDGKVRLFVGKNMSSTFASSFVGGRVLRGGYALSSSGDLYYGDTLVSAGVYAAQGWEKDSAIASIVLTDGTTQRATGATIDATYTAIANRVVSVGGGFALTPTGDLYFDGTKVVGQVKSARGWIASGTVPSASALGTDGKVRRISWSTSGSGSATTSTLSPDFTGGIVLRGGYVLSANGVLYHNDSQVSTGVMLAEGYQRSDSTASFMKYDC